MRRRETHRWEGAETEFYRKLEAGYMGEVRWEKEVGGGGGESEWRREKDPEKKKLHRGGNVWPPAGREGS